VGGFILVAFGCPLSALRFGAGVQEDMKAAPWSPALLRQPLAEELATQRATVRATEPGARGNNEAGGRLVLLRGPRIKASTAPYPSMYVLPVIASCHSVIVAESDLESNANHKCAMPIANACMLCQS
jgi:hypothetical protein